MKTYQDFGIYDFSDYAEEITGEDLIKINGGSSSCGGGGPGNGGSSAASGGSGPGNGGSSAASGGSGPGNGGSSAASGGSGSKGSGSSSIGASSGSCGGGGSPSVPSGSSGNSGSGFSTSGSCGGRETSTSPSIGNSGNGSGGGNTPLSSGIGSCGGSTPVSEMKTSTKGIDFITSYEGFSSNIYDAKNKSNNYLSGISTYEDGDWTIGYGHKLTEQEFEGKVFENGIDKTVAKQIRVKDLSWVEEGIQKNFNGKLTQQQFDALVSLGINKGRQGLIDSDPFKNAESGVTDVNTIKKDFIQYNKGYNSSTGKLEYMLGLERRRYDEVEMYLYGDYIRNDDLTLDKPVF